MLLPKSFHSLPRSSVQIFVGVGPIQKSPKEQVKKIMSLLDDWLKPPDPEEGGQSTDPPGGSGEPVASVSSAPDPGHDDDDPMDVGSSLPADLQLPDLGLSDIKWWVDLEFLDLASGPPANISGADKGDQHDRQRMKTPTFE